MPPSHRGRPQAGLAASYHLDGHPGGVREDGVAALVESIIESPEPITLIAIGPLTNVAAALELEPRIAEKARLVAMLGSVRRGELGRPVPIPEYNVLVDPPACRAALTAPWEVTITPLDSCGEIVLEGERYAALRRSDDPLLRTVLGTYDEWCEALLAEPEVLDEGDVPPRASQDRSTVLYDTAAVYLAYAESLLEIEELPIAVADDGSTVISPDARKIRVATECQLQGFLDHLTERLLPTAAIS